MSRTKRKVQHWVKDCVDSENFDPRNPYHNGRDGSSRDKYGAYKHSPKGFNKWDSVSPLTAWKDKRCTRRLIKSRGKKEISQELYDLEIDDNEPNHKPKKKRVRRPECSYSPRRYYQSYRQYDEKRIDYVKIFKIRDKIDQLTLHLKNLQVQKSNVHKTMVSDVEFDILSVEEKINNLKNELAITQRGY